MGEEEGEAVRVAPEADGKRSCEGAAVPGGMSVCSDWEGVHLDSFPPEPAAIASQLLAGGCILPLPPVPEVSTLIVDAEADDAILFSLA